MIRHDTEVWESAYSMQLHKSGIPNRDITKSQFSSVRHGPSRPMASWAVPAHGLSWTSPYWSAWTLDGPDWVNFVRSFWYNPKYIIFSTFLHRMVLHISNQLRKAQNFPFGDGYSLARSTISNKKIVVSLAGLGLGLEILSFNGLGLGWAQRPLPWLGWAVGWPARGKHCISALTRPSVAWFFEDC